MHLASLRERKPEELASGQSFTGNVIVDSEATIGKDCKIGPNVSIGKLCKIGDGVRLVNCVLLHRVEVPAPSHCRRHCVRQLLTLPGSPAGLLSGSRQLHRGCPARGDWSCCACHASICNIERHARGPLRGDKRQPDVTACGLSNRRMRRQSAT